MPTEAGERRNAYQQDKKQGNCPRCGIKKKKKYKYIFCEDCRSYFRDYHNANSAKQNKKRKANYNFRLKNKQCPRCGKKLGKKYPKKICLVCLEKQYSYNK